MPYSVFSLISPPLPSHYYYLSAYLYYVGMTSVNGVYIYWCRCMYAMYMFVLCSVCSYCFYRVCCTSPYNIVNIIILYCYSLLLLVSTYSSIWVGFGIAVFCFKNSVNAWAVSWLASALTDTFRLVLSVLLVALP